MDPTFEIGVFNAEVRAAVREGEHHKNLKDEWADIHYFELKARDETLAREQISKRYPSEQGFVIAAVAKLTIHEDEKPRFAARR